MLSMLRISVKKVMQGTPSVRIGGQAVDVCTFSIMFDICFVIHDLLSTLARASTAQEKKQQEWVSVEGFRPYGA